MGRALARITRPVTMRHLRRVTAVTGDGGGLVDQVYAQVVRDFGMLAPPITLHAAAPEVMAAAWAMLRETLLVPGLAGRGTKEAVAVAVSAANECPYCVDIHRAALDGLGLRGSPASPLAAWFAEPRGPAPFPPEHAAELIGVAVCFHYLNRMVNVFLVDSPLPPLPPSWAGPARRGAGWVLGRLARTHPAPGRSADLLAPAVSRPAGPAWAAGAAAVAEAFAGAAAAIDAAGRRSVPASVREIVTDCLAGPGLPAAPGAVQAWLEARVGTLPAADRPAGRLALLTALASYRVTDATVGELRESGADDGAVIAVAAWSALTAARHIGTTLAAAAESAAPDR
jgi:AhpD family alkylhydroperoxidase